MEEYMHESAPARQPGRKYAQSEASEKISDIGSLWGAPKSVKGCGRHGGRDSDHTKRAHSGPKLRFGPAATACAKAPRQPVEGRI